MDYYEHLAIDCARDVIIPLNHKIFTVSLPEQSRFLPGIRQKNGFAFTAVYGYKTSSAQKLFRFYLLKESWDFKKCPHGCSEVPGYEPITERLTSANLIGSFVDNNLTNHLFLLPSDV